MTRPKQRRARGAHTLAALAVLSLFAGCGSSSEDAAAPEAAEADTPAHDICALLTDADLEEVLGTSAAAGRAGNEALGQCTWSASGGTTTLVSITLDDAVLRSFDDFVLNYGVEFGGENPPEDEYHPVQGVPGDWAMYVAEEHMVRAFRGGRVLEVRAEGAEEALVVDLATRAMGRLP